MTSEMAVAKLPSILDERGNRWCVRPGDPGDAAVKLLKKLGFNQPVLPISVLAGRRDVSVREAWEVKTMPQVSHRWGIIVIALEEYVWTRPS